MMSQNWGYLKKNVWLRAMLYSAESTFSTVCGRIYQRIWTGMRNYFEVLNRGLGAVDLWKNKRSKISWDCLFNLNGSFKSLNGTIPSGPATMSKIRGPCITVLLSSGKRLGGSPVSWFVNIFKTWSCHLHGDSQSWLWIQTSDILP
jgi:hypothetical protein